MKRFKVLCLLLILSGFINYCFGKEVSVEKARAIAKNVYFERINLVMEIPYNSISFTEEITVKDNSQPLYYIFNVAGEGGFVIISAEDLVYPVLAYSFRGSLDSYNLPPNARLWIKRYEEQIIIAKENKITPNKNTADAWIKYSEYSPGKGLKSLNQVNPLVTATWNQGGFYNDSCPADPNGPGGNALVGCVAVAMGQIMRYHNSPAQGSGFHSFTHPVYGLLSANFGVTTYNWSAMPDNLNSPNSSVAQLLYHCGVATNMNYGPYASGTFSANARNALISYFGYANSTEIDYKQGYTEEKWNQLLRSELDASWPMYYAGTDLQGMSAHAFVCDGYQGSNHFHFNWGWGGWADGYFYTWDLTPGSSNFNANQHIIKIRPAGTYDFCWGLTFLNSPSGSFNDGSGTHFYNNNSFCRWVIQPPGATSITVNFVSFNTESGADKLNIFDGDNMGSPLIGSFSGNNLPSPVTSSSGKVLITFITDSYVSDEGWEISYTSATTGIDDNIETELFSVYPNPGKGVFEIEFINETTGDLNLIISEITGRELVKIKTVKEQYVFRKRIDLTELSSGIYFLKLGINNSPFSRYIIIE